MKICLHYRGELKTNGSPKDKHAIRKVFHKQLKQLWSQKPLVDMPNLLGPEIKGDYSLRRQIGDFCFIPLITDKMNVTADIKILLLRPQEPGGIISKGGDIDNRLKTLLDALSKPPHLSALPRTEKPQEDEIPYFYCLLEDDNLITSLDIQTEQLLETGLGRSDVDLTIIIETRISQMTYGNTMFV